MSAILLRYSSDRFWSALLKLTVVFYPAEGMPSEDTSNHPLPSILVSYRALSRLANSFCSIFDFSFQKLRDALPQASYLQGKDVYFDGFSYFNKTEEGSSLQRLPRQRASLSLCWGIGLPRRSSKMHCGSGSAWCAWRSRRDAAVPWSLWSRQGTRPWPIWKNTFFGAEAPTRIRWWQPGEAVWATTAYAEVEYVRPDPADAAQWATDAEILP